MVDSTQGDKSGAPLWLAAVLVFLALVISGVAVGMARGGDEDGDTASTTAPAAAPTELVLEPASGAGDDPFTASVAIFERPVAPDATLVSTTPVDGGTPGLYGGTQDQRSCDPTALVDFLNRNPDKAAAWARVLDITPAGIADHVAALTPVVLRVDTRVTNHGFADGVATPRQSVLQAGTAVLVDDTGTPRVRCACGNPLTEPAPLGATLPAAIDAGTVTVVGTPWIGWGPQQVVVVRGTVVVTQFALWDLVNGGTFEVQIGGAPATTTTTTTEPPSTTTTAPPATTTTTAPPSTTDCRDDPPMSEDDYYEDSGDRGCDPATGLYMCYRGAEVIVCPVQRP